MKSVRSNIVCVYDFRKRFLKEVSEGTREYVETNLCRKIEHRVWYKIAQKLSHAEGKRL